MDTVADLRRDPTGVLHAGLSQHPPLQTVAARVTQVTTDMRSWVELLLSEYAFDEFDAPDDLHADDASAYSSSLRSSGGSSSSSGEPPAFRSLLRASRSKAWPASHVPCLWPSALDADGEHMQARWRSRWAVAAESPWLSEVRGIAWWG